MSAPDRDDVARILLEKAEGDLHALETLAPDKSQADHVLGLFAQQAVEKSAKAVLAARGVEIPRTHDVGYLCELLAEAGADIPDAVAAADWLTPWAGTWRYDSSDEHLDRVKASEAAQAALTWARDRLRDLG